MAPRETFEALSFVWRLSAGRWDVSVTAAVRMQGHPKKDKAAVSELEKAEVG